jgi:hypothetical protein
MAEKQTATQTTTAYSLEQLKNLNAKMLDAALGAPLRGLRGSTIITEEGGKEITWSLVEKQKRGSATLFQWYCTDKPEHVYTGTLDNAGLNAHLREHIISLAYEQFVFLNNATGVYKPVGSGDTRYFTNEAGAFLKGEVSPMGALKYKKLANFTAQITKEVIKETPRGITRTYHIEGLLEDSGEYENRELPSIEVGAAEFYGMKWVPAKWGSNAIPGSGYTTRDELREAIQRYSGDTTQEYVYTHTGWIQRDSKWYYLSHSGAIGADGLDPSVVLDMGQIESLKKYELPAPDAGTVVDDFNALMELVDTLGRSTITYPFVSTVFRISLCQCEPIGYVLYYVGRTGTRKTTLVALGFNFFGWRFTHKNLPSVKISTTNAVGMLLNLLKDMPVVFDDMVLTGERITDAKLVALQEEYIRHVTDGVSKFRVKRDASGLLPEDDPRGGGWGTGETPPTIESSIARNIITRLKKGDINIDVLSKAQDDARTGKWARLNASYNQWNAPQMEELNETIPALHDTLLHDDEITQLFGGRHSRTAPALISMYAGFDHLMKFGVAIKAQTEEQADARRALCKAAFYKLAKEQTPYLESSDPLLRVIEMTQTALITGKAYVNDHQDAHLMTKDRHAWGYVDNENPLKNADRIGWLGDVTTDDGATRRELWLHRGAWETLLTKVASQRNRTLQQNFDEIIRQMRESDEKYIDPSTSKKGSSLRRIGKAGRQRVLIMDASHILPPLEEENPDEEYKQFCANAISFFMNYGEVESVALRPTPQQLKDAYLTSGACLDVGIPMLDLRAKLNKALEENADVKKAFDKALTFGVP